MTDRLYAGGDATGMLLASCDGIQIQIDNTWLRESFKDAPDVFSDRSLALGGGVTIVASGRVEDIASIHTLRARSLEPALYPYFLLYEDGGSLQGDFGLENWSEGRPGGDPKRFSARLVSHRVPVYDDGS